MNRDWKTQPEESAENTRGWVRVERDVRRWKIVIYAKETVEPLARYLEQFVVEALAKYPYRHEMGLLWHDRLDADIGNGNRVAEPR